MKFTTHVRFLPRLRMSGAIPLLPLYVFVVRVGTALPIFEKINNFFFQSNTTYVLNHVYRLHVKID